jgi:alpha-1,3-rhamnosyl/mannosyltransferase
LYIGSNKPHKNLMRLVKAWAKIPPPPDISLVIAGVWDRRFPEVKLMAQELGLTGSMIFLGPVEEADLPALYSGALAFVFPSEYEGFGLPVLEAMACGVPVACSNVSSLPEVAGDAALTFAPMDVEAMAATLHRLIKDAELRVNLKERGLHRAAQFSWEKTAQATLHLYRELL